ncbi:MAG TPA: TIGR03618 family F420-dependent PPOX class oxidoreductase [Streptosporangiaceae bacterium]|jgi:PPOX class probable F420-dependent enzyme
MPLDEDAARLAKAQNLATVITVLPDGQPHAQLTWVDHDGENILVNTEPQRQKAKNARRNPKITVMIHSADPWDWAEVRGHLARTVDGAEARAHIDEVSRRYSGEDFDEDIVGPHGRVILVIAPDKVVTPRSLGKR